MLNRGGIAAVACMLLCGGVVVAEESTGIKWTKTFDSALKEAESGKKLVMIDFCADWCGPCKQLDKVTYSDAKVIEAVNKDFVSIKLDVDQPANGPVAQKYGITGLPTILFVDGKGEVYGKYVGYRAAAPFLKEIGLTQRAFVELPKLLETLKAMPADMKVAKDVISIFISQGKVDQASKVLSDAKSAGVEGKELASSYNELGDHQQTNGNFDAATPLFRKAAELGAAKEKIYALSSIAACLVSQGKLKEAFAESEKAVAIEASKEDLKDALAQHEGLKKEIEAIERAEKLMGWAKDFDSAIASAKSGKKLAMVDFYTTWCGPCKMLERDVYAKESAAKEIGELCVAFKIDAESEAGMPLAKKYNVSAYPTILFIDGEGKVAGKIVGYKPAAQFVMAMKDLVSAWKDMPGVLAKWKENPKDTEVAVKLLKMRMAREEVKEAANMIGESIKAGASADKVLEQVFASSQELIDGGSAENAKLLLEKAMEHGTPAHKAKAQVYSAVGMLRSGPNPDFKAILALVDKALASPDIPEDAKQLGQRIQTVLKQQLNAKGGDE